MKILVLNCGSSSIKYKLFDMTTKEVKAQGGIEKIGLPGSFLKFTLPNGDKKILEKDIPEHTAGIEFILNTLVSEEYGAIKSLEEINAVGHRMVHGGEKFAKSVLLDKEVLEAFVACNDLAPLHNPANLKGVNAVTAILPNVPQVGVFDTAFHQTMPDYAYMYAVPYELYTKYGVRRYGFHGTSHRYVSQRVCEFLNIPVEGTKIITCHIGNGASISAVKDGKVVDTSMGFKNTGFNVPNSKLKIKVNVEGGKEPLKYFLRYKTTSGEVTTDENDPGYSTGIFEVTSFLGDSGTPVDYVVWVEDSVEQNLSLSSGETTIEMIMDNKDSVAPVAQLFELNTFVEDSATSSEERESARPTNSSA